MENWTQIQEIEWENNNKIVLIIINNNNYKKSIKERRTN